MMNALFVLPLMFAASTATVEADISKSATQEVPAALVALGYQPELALDRDSAQAIRGEGRKLGPHHPSLKHPGNKYTGHRTGQNLKPGWGNLR